MEDPLRVGNDQYERYEQSGNQAPPCAPKDADFLYQHDTQGYVRDSLDSEYGHHALLLSEADHHRGTDLITHHGPQRNAYYRQDLSGNPSVLRSHPQRYERLPADDECGDDRQNNEASISSSINEHALHAFDLPRSFQGADHGHDRVRYPAQYLTRILGQRFRDAVIRDHRHRQKSSDEYQGGVVGRRTQDVQSRRHQAE